MRHHPLDAVDTAMQVEPCSLPLNDERLSGQAEAFKEHEKANTPNSTDILAQRKTEVVLIAMYAMAGFDLVKVAGGTWGVRRWGMAKPLPTIDNIEDFFSRIGGGHA